jgi:hypothetical protein
MYNPPTVSVCNVSDPSFDNWFTGIVFRKTTPAGNTTDKTKSVVPLPLLEWCNDKKEKKT